MPADPNPVKALFLEAVEQHAPDQWPAFLDRACAGQPDVRRPVEVLLEAHREARSAQHQAAADESAPAPGGVNASAEWPGPAELSQESRVLAAVKAYQDALERGQRLDRQAWLAR